MPPSNYTPTVQRPTPITSQTDTTNEKRDVSEVIDFMSPFDTPFLDLIGRDSLHSPATQLKHEWMTDALTPRSGTIAAAYTSGDLEFTVTSPEGNYCVPGDMVQVGDAPGHIYRIEAIAAQVWTVRLIRGTGASGTTDADHANASAWRRMSHAAQEAGSARNDGPKTNMDMPYNYPQILKDWIIVSGTMEVLDRYGYANERAYQEEKTLRRMALDLEYSLIYGGRYFDGGPPRVSSMGGLAEFILYPGIQNSWTNVVNFAGADITEKLMNDMLEKIFDEGGEVDFVLVNGNNKRFITSWATPRIRTAQGERTAGASIAVYESDFGMVDIVVDRWLRPSDIIYGSRGECGIGPLVGRQFTSRLLPSTIDGTWYELLGEYTMEVHKPSMVWGWQYNTSTSYSE